MPTIYFHLSASTRTQVSSKDKYLMHDLSFESEKFSEFITMIGYSTFVAFDEPWMSLNLLSRRRLLYAVQASRSETAIILRSNFWRKPTSWVMTVWISFHDYSVKGHTQMYRHVTGTENLSRRWSTITTSPFPVIDWKNVHAASWWAEMCRYREYNRYCRWK